VYTFNKLNDRGIPSKEIPCFKGRIYNAGVQIVTVTAENIYTMVTVTGTYHAPPTSRPRVHQKQTRMWANAQPDGRPAKHRWRPLFNAA